MQTFVIVMLCLMSLQVFAGLIAIANRIPPKPMTPTDLAVRTFVRLAFCGWAIYLLALGGANV
jgi:hypothetical protein